MKDTAVYIHIPFCDHKCIYCDFYSIITSDNISPFLNAVKKEIEYYGYYSADRRIVSIFFGGGTPSLLEPSALSDIINTVRNNFNVSDSVEITMESNPGTLDYYKLTDFRRAGINRISIGVQSFDDEDLKFLTRIHNSKTAVATILNAEKAGYNNISLDLIFNLPGQTKTKWESNLITASDLPISHISAYSLILERGTILNKMVLDGKVKIEDEDYDAELYELTIDYLVKKGYQQYEVSNFAKPGFECVHNNCYWRYKDYLSFGPSAHSFVNGKRWWNYSSLKMYLSKVETSGNAVCSQEEPDNDQRLNEYIMLALRSSGIDIIEVNEHFDSKWFKRNEEYLLTLENFNFIKFTNNHIKLTARGYAVCDEILKKLV